MRRELLALLDASRNPIGRSNSYLDPASTGRVERQRAFCPLDEHEVSAGRHSQLSGEAAHQLLLIVGGSMGDRLLGLRRQFA